LAISDCPIAIFRKIRSLPAISTQFWCTDQQWLTNHHAIIAFNKSNIFLSVSHAPVGHEIVVPQSVDGPVHLLGSGTVSQALHDHHLTDCTALGNNVEHRLLQLAQKVTEWLKPDWE
jgi:hypothetical protein